MGWLSRILGWGDGPVTKVVDQGACLGGGVRVGWSDGQIVIGGCSLDTVPARGVQRWGGRGGRRRYSDDELRLIAVSGPEDEIWEGDQWVPVREVLELRALLEVARSDWVAWELRELASMYGLD